MIEVYQDVLAIVTSYMGPVAEEYLKRRCSVSCSLQDPTQLRPEHLERLADSIGLTAEVYVREGKAKQFKEEILRLRAKLTQGKSIGR